MNIFLFDGLLGEKNVYLNEDVFLAGFKPYSSQLKHSPADSNNEVSVLQQFITQSHVLITTCLTYFLSRNVYVENFVWTASKNPSLFSMMVQLSPLRMTNMITCTNLSNQITFSPHLSKQSKNFFPMKLRMR